jgi:hypothetical protein
MSITSTCDQNVSKLSVFIDMFLGYVDIVNMNENGLSCSVSPENVSLVCCFGYTFKERIPAGHTFESIQ